MENKVAKYFIITTFVLLYVITSAVSTIHVIDFFRMSNPDWLAITLAIAYEIGAAASLASLIALRKMNKGIVWALFIILTAMQAMGNVYYSYIHLNNYQPWIELFGLIEEDPIFQKRIIAIVSGAVLPLVALGFIKSLVDYIKPNDDKLIVDVVDEEIIVEEKQESKSNTSDEEVYDSVDMIRDVELSDTLFIESSVTNDLVVNEVVPTQEIPIVIEQKIINTESKTSENFDVVENGNLVSNSNFDEDSIIESSEEMVSVENTLVENLIEEERIEQVVVETLIEDNVDEQSSVSAEEILDVNADNVSEESVVVEIVNEEILDVNADNVSEESVAVEIVNEEIVESNDITTISEIGGIMENKIDIYETEVIEKNMENDSPSVLTENDKEVENSDDMNLDEKKN